jgi:hypothetical protein
VTEAIGLYALTSDPKTVASLAAYPLEPSRGVTTARREQAASSPYTTITRSSRNAARAVSSLSFDEKASKVFLTSYFPR